MTVSSEVNRAGPYLGNGSTTVFGFGFRILSASHLRVIITDEDGVETDLPYPSGYSVSGVGVNAGGSITINPAPVTGSKITILRNVPMVQETDLENQGAYYAETVERALDLVVMQNQQQAEELRRAVKVPAGDPDPDGALSTGLARGILRLYDSADNLDVVAGSVSEIDQVAGSIAAVRTVADMEGVAQTVAGAVEDVTAVADNIANVRTVAGSDEAINLVAQSIPLIETASGSVVSMLHIAFVGDGVTTEFDLGAIASAENVLAWIGGVRQVPGDDYTMAGEILTFTDPPADGVEIEGLVITAVSMGDIQALYDDFLGGVTITKQNLITVAGQRRYPLDAAGQPFNLRSSTSAIFGASPFGMLTPGVDYTIDGGVPLFTFDPADGELFHVVGFPRVSNTEAQALVQDYKDELLAVQSVFTNYAAALAAATGGAVGAGVNAVSWISGGREFTVVRQVGGPCLGGGWVPAGDVTPQHFGGVDRAAINAAAAYVAANGGGTVTLPRGASYTANGPILLTNGTVLQADIARSVTLTLTAGSKLIDMASSVNCGVRGLRLVGTGRTGTDPFIDMAASMGCDVEENHFVDAPGSIYGVVDIQTGSFNKVSRNLFTGARTSGIALRQAAHDNEANGNEFRTGVVGFGIRCEGFSNDLSFNRCIENPIELIGVFRTGYANRVMGNHAEGTGDNGISISGKRNVVTGNVCQYNLKAGIWIWGSFNTITGNICIGNNRAVLTVPGNSWAGIGVSANYGGCGQHNTITGNTCDDDQATMTQQNGVRLAGSSYVDWVAATSYTKSDQGTYVTNGLNIYLMVTNGTVNSGATPPTHTAGEVSDGAIVWRYVETFVGTKGSVNNTIVGNSLMRSVGDPILDTVGGSLAMIIDRSMMKIQTAGNVRMGTNTGSVWDVEFGGVATHRFFSNRMRPVTDGGVSIGDTNARYAQVYAQAISIGPAGTNIIETTGTGSPEGVITASVGSKFINRTGTPGSVLWAKTTGTGNTGWTAIA